MTSAGIIASATGATATITRQYFYAQALGEASNFDNAVWTNHLTMSFTPDNAAHYVAFWTCEFTEVGSLDPLTGQAHVRLRQDGSTIDTVIMQPMVTGDWNCQAGMHFLTGAGAAMVLTMDFRRGSDFYPATSARIRNARIVVLRLETADKFAQSLPAQTNTIATFNDALTLSFTPATPGSYLVLGFGIVTGGLIDVHHVRLYDGALGTPDLSVNFANGREKIGVCQAWVKPGLSGPQTVKLQYRSGSSPQVSGIIGARIVALRMDGFSHVYDSVLNGDTAGGGASFVEALSLSRTIHAKEFLTLAAYAMKVPGGTAPDALECQVVDPTGVVGDVIGKRPGAYTHGFTATVGAYAAGTRAWSLQVAGPGGTPGSELNDNAVIAALQLN